MGSETISSKWVEGAKRECIRCGVKITNLDKQVGEVRTTYPSGKREIICMDCRKADAMRLRERLYGSSP